jgi:hypothetical protein
VGVEAPRYSPTMSRVVGDALPDALVERLSQRDLASRLGVALTLVTVDTEERPHPMMVSYLELRAYDAGSVGLVIQVGSDSARNLETRDRATLVMIEPDLVVYVKLRRLDGALPVAEDPRLAYFLLTVEEVREDASTAEEAGARIIAGPRYAPVPALDSPWVRVTRAAVATPRARA